MILAKNGFMPPEIIKQLKTGEITRFAPSPSGYLHLGHVFSARFAVELAESSGGRALLRIDDIDTTRCRERYFGAIFEDLDFMGIGFDGEPRYQSQHLKTSRDALATLKAQGFIYPCYLSRRELAGLLSAPHLPRNTDELIDAQQKTRREEGGDAPAWRLRMEAVRTQFPHLNAIDLLHGDIAIDLTNIGDEVIARRDIGTSYHLSTVLDDADMGISLVSRGADLLPSVPLQRILQELLGLPAPRYVHHQLLTTHDGARLAKRENALSLRQMRENGMRRADIYATMIKCR